MSAARPKPLVLCILDGWGYREARENNAIALANTPVFDALWQNHPHCLLRTDGAAVGLPAGQMGNSEVGHITLGAGRVQWQDLPRIDQAIESGELGKHPALLDTIAKLHANKGTVHLIGLLSTGGVHSHQNHVAAIANIFARAGVRVAIHAFLDGRDRPPQAALNDIPEFLSRLDPSPLIKLATLCGRYYAMDRDQRWDRTKLAYDLLVDGVGDTFGEYTTGLITNYAIDKNDEFVEPIVIGSYTGMHDGDALICCNFRADRVRQTLAALTLPDFNNFNRARTINFCATIGLTNYGGATKNTLTTLFKHTDLTDTFAEVIARAGFAQLRIAETEKHPHVTYYFSGATEAVQPGEERILVPSPKVATYDLQPAMSAREVTSKLLDAVASGAYDFILVNYANPDMVGHTGKLDAAIAAIECLDECLGRLVPTVLAKGGALLITADHGNSEEMWDNTAHAPHTQHSLNPVPCILVGRTATPQNTTLHDGTLADIAPTMLQLLRLPQPAGMTGKSLL